MDQDNIITQKELENRLHHYKQAQITENLTLEQKIQLANKLQKLISLKEEYLKKQHQKRYGFLARFFNTQRTAKSSPFLQNFEIRLNQEVFNLSETLKAYISPQTSKARLSLHQAIKICIVLQDLNSFPVTIYAPFKQTLQQTVRHNPLLKAYNVTMWNNQVVLLPQSATDSIKPYRRWPSFLFKTHNACHDFIKAHSEPMAIAASILADVNSPVNIDDVKLTDVAINFTMQGFYKLRAKKGLSESVLNFVENYINPITSQRQMWLEKKIRQATTLLDNIRNTLVRHYPMTMSQLCAIDAHFRANCELANALLESIKADRQQPIEAKVGLIRQFEAAKSAWLEVSTDDLRSLQPVALSSKSSLIKALTHDINYLGFCNYPDMVSEQTKALTLLKNMLEDKKCFIASKYEAHSLSYYLQSLFQFTHTHYMTCDYFMDGLAHFIDTEVSLGSDAFDALAYHFPLLASQRLRYVEETLAAHLASEQSDFINKALTLLVSHQPNPTTFETKQRYERLCQQCIEKLKARLSLVNDTALLAFNNDRELQKLTAASLFRLPESKSRQALIDIYQAVCVYDLKHRGIQMDSPSVGTNPNSEETSTITDIDVEALSMDYFDLLASPEEEILRLTEERLAILWKDCTAASSHARSVLLKKLERTAKEDIYPEICREIQTFLQAVTPISGSNIIDLIQQVQHSQPMTLTIK